MLRAFVIDFKGSSDEHISLVEFSYNNSYHSTISMDIFIALYGKRCRSPIDWFETGASPLFGPELIYKTLEKDHFIRNQLQTSYR